MIDPPQVLSEEPTAVTPHGGICGGESQQWLSYPTKPHVGSVRGAVSNHRPYREPPNVTPVIPALDLAHTMLAPYGAKPGLAMFSRKTPSRRDRQGA